MATIKSLSDSKAGEFTINPKAHGYPDGPDHVLVEIAPGRSGTYMAIIAAGVDGRYSFDFRVSGQGVEIVRVYIEGMRERIEALPDWADPIRERIEEELEL